MSSSAALRRPAVSLRQVLADSGVRWVLAGWAAFTAENVILSEYRVEIRRSWGGAGGQNAYQGLYSFLSTTTLGSTVAAYWRFGRHGVAIRPPGGAATPSARVGAFLLRALGFVTLAQLAPPLNLAAAPIAIGLTTPSRDLPPEVRGAMGCPFDFNAYKDRGEVFGITRVTRRPELFGLMAVGLGGALLATTVTQVCFYGLGPVVSFTLLALHSERTQRASGDLSVEKESQTSLIPFAALLDGRQSFADLRDDLDATNLNAAVIVAGLAAFRPPWMRWLC